MASNRDDANEPDSSRRSLLQRVAAGSVAAAGLGGLSATTEAAARTDMAAKERLSAEYRSESAVRGASRSTPATSSLADEGLVESGDPADLVTEPRSTGEHLSSDRSVNVGAVPAEDGLTAHIELAYRTDDYDLHVLVQPQAGRTYAYIDRGDSVGRVDYDSEDDVTIQERCVLGEACDNQLCSDNTGNYKVYRVECCEDSGCDVGYVVDCCHQFPGYVDPCCEACGC